MVGTQPVADEFIRKLVANATHICAVALCLLASIRGNLAATSGTAGGVEESVDHPKRTDVGISVMLFGGVSFAMVVVHLVNHPDADVRRYSWRVLSTTISISLGMLTFQVCDGFVEYCLFTESTHISFELAVDMVHTICWFCILQAVLRFISNAWVCGALASSMSQLFPEPSDQAKIVRIEKFDNLEINMKTVGIMFGYITGFAAINAWGTSQRFIAIMYSLQSPLEKQVLGLCAVVSAAVVTYGFLLLTSRLRLGVRAGDDGEDKEFEGYGNELAYEIENCAIGLIVAFLAVENLRLVFGDGLPVEGEEEELRYENHSTKAIISLILVGMFLGVCALANVQRKRSVRLRDCLNLSCAMSSAMCFLYAMQWLVYADWSQSTPALCSAISALLATALAPVLGCNRCLLHFFSGKQQSAIDACAIIESLGIFVGLSWEKSFSAAVDCVAESIATSSVSFIPESVIKLGLVVCLCFIVVPGWRWYILPTQISLDEKACVSALEVERTNSLQKPLLADEASKEVRVSFEMEHSDATASAAKTKYDLRCKIKDLRCEASEIRLRREYEEVRSRKKVLKSKATGPVAKDSSPEPFSPLSPLSPLSRPSVPSPKRNAGNKPTLKSSSLEMVKDLSLLSPSSPGKAGVVAHNPALGSYVEAHSLTSQPEFNGKRGRVLRIEGDRVVVKFDGIEESEARLKLTRIKPVETVASPKTKQALLKGLRSGEVTDIIASSCSTADSQKFSRKAVNDMSDSDLKKAAIQNGALFQNVRRMSREELCTLLAKDEITPPVSPIGQRESETEPAQVTPPPTPAPAPPQNLPSPQPADTISGDSRGSHENEDTVIVSRSVAETCGFKGLVNKDYDTVTIRRGLIETCGFAGLVRQKREDATSCPPRAPDEPVISAPSSGTSKKDASRGRCVNVTSEDEGSSARSLSETCGFSGLVSENREDARPQQISRPPLPPGSADGSAPGDPVRSAPSSGTSKRDASRGRSVNVTADDEGSSVRSLSDTCGFSGLRAAQPKSETIAEPSLSDRVAALTADVERLRSMLLPRRGLGDPMHVDLQQDDREEVKSKLASTGSSATELSLRLSDARRDFQEKADQTCQMERDVALLRVGLSEAYHQFWTQNHRRCDRVGARLGSPDRGGARLGSPYRHV